MLEKLFSVLLGVLQDLRRVRFRTHLGVHVLTGQNVLFLTVTNLSRTREIEVTHVWIASNPQVAAVLDERPLPKRLKPDEIWETWIPVADISELTVMKLLLLGRLRISTGQITKSRPDSEIPDEGYVPGEIANASGGAERTRIIRKTVVTWPTQDKQR